MVLINTVIYLEDDAAVQRRNRRSWLLSWTTKIVINIINRAVNIAQDEVFAAAEEQVSELRKELDNAGLLEALPMSFGGKPKLRTVGDKSIKSMGKHKAKKNRNKNKNKTVPQQIIVSKGDEDNMVDIILGNEYICFYSGDNLWYPAIIENVLDECWFSVKYLGYGNVETIPKTWIQQHIETSSSNMNSITDSNKCESPISGEIDPLEHEVDNKLELINEVDEVDHQKNIESCDMGGKPKELELELELDNQIVVMDASDYIENNREDDYLNVKRRKKPCKASKGRIANWSGLDSPNPFPQVDDKYWAQR